MDSIARELLVGFDEEMTATKKTLERVPMDRQDWKPHEKSMAIGRLAAHVATLPQVALSALTESTMDATMGFQMPVFTTNDELVATFQKLSGEMRAAVERMTDDEFRKTWTLTAGGKTILSAPRSRVVRMFMFNHMIHHRAQLGVYLRLNEIPVPAIYGPSADEKIM